MKTVSKANKALAIWATVSILSLAGYIFLFLEVKKQNESVATLSDTLELELERNERLSSIESLVEDTVLERESLKEHFLTEEGVVDFLKTIEEIGQTSGTALEIQSADIQTKEDGTSDLILKVGVNGSWNNLFHLISLIENLSTASDITEAFLSSSNNAEGVSIWRGSFSIETLMRE